jgi:cytochrome c heme-lyase
MTLQCSSPNYSCPHSSMTESSCPVSSDDGLLVHLNGLDIDYNSRVHSALDTGSLPPGISMERVESSIPRTGTNQRWKYPSAAMFYVAIEKKGYGNAIGSFKANPNDLNAVVHIHNIVNEQTWNKILNYERLHSNKASMSPPCSNSSSPLSEESTMNNGPTLTKFIGRPADISPKARLRSWFGYSLPFDRHDWYVDRNGKTIRYVIDFYTGASSSKDSDVPSFYLDVRPELSFQGIIDRIHLQWKNLFNDSHK